jgi:NADPH:quinone reductase
MELPRRPLAPEVRVAVEAVGVNPVDASNSADPSWAGLEPPYVVGYEFVGPRAGPGRASRRPPNRRRGLRIAAGARDSLRRVRRRVVADARFVASRALALSATEAAALPLAGTTALQLLDRLGPAPGEWILVHGAAGGVGHLFV